MKPTERMASTLLANEHQKQDFIHFRQRVLDGGEPYVISDAVAPAEILHTMDIPVVPVVWYSAIIAAKQLSPHYFSLMDNLDILLIGLTLIFLIVVVTLQPFAYFAGGS